MKKIFPFLFALFCGSICFAQWSNKSYNFGGVNRQYRVYLPSGYNPSNHYPLVMTLHGLGDNMTNFSAIGMNTIADTAKFIIVVPQAVTDPLLSTTAWNSGAGMMGIYPNANIDDVGFLGSLIDTMQTNYAINPNRIYVCGFSMGGYMTERLACELTTRIAAIASMAGTIGSGMASCSPGRKIPVAHFHGTSDQTVPYSANNSGIDVDSLISFWVAKNACNPTPVHSSLPNIANDGYTVDHYVYSGSDEHSIVELFKVNGADHVWLTQANDISYSIEAWKFFSRYDLGSSPTGINEPTGNLIKVFPNPVRDFLTVDIPFQSFRLRLSNINGQVLFDKEMMRGERLDVSQIVAGNYFLVISAPDKNYYGKVVIEK